MMTENAKPLSGLIRHSYCPALVALLLVFAPLLQADSQLYRYINEKGVQVIDDKVPPQFVSKGYDIILQDGTLLQSVPRQLSGEELRLRNTDESRARLQVEEEQKMRAWDESLLLRYSSIEDIEAAQKRAMRNLHIRISILRSNLAAVKSQIEREQSKAADLERRGIDVPQEMISVIDTLRLEIEDTEQSIALRREEIGSLKASYQRDIDRFKTLLDSVEMRRKSYRSSATPKPSYYQGN